MVEKKASLERDTPYYANTRAMSLLEWERSTHRDTYMQMESIQHSRVL